MERLMREEMLRAEERSINRFADCENVNELIHQLVGAGSTCWVEQWDKVEGKQRVFDTDEAKAVADDGIERLMELGWA
jgi:hypothetical protein